MREKAFTLIEVMVVMAIISILAGMMAPAVWKYWESEEIATTRERMREIKKGLVGDRSLVQNGVRTHFGFVGDNGELPFHNFSASGGLSYLVSKPVGGYPNWSGPYLTGFSSDWDKDAWGKAFRYSLTKDIYGRYVNAELRSAGPDGVFDNVDDIVDPDIQISETEVMGTNKIKANIPNDSGSNKSLDLSITFKDPILNPDGITTITSECVAFTTFARYTTMTISANKLPIGGIDIIVNGHTDTGCSGPPSPLSKYKYFVNSGINPIILSN